MIIFLDIGCYIKELILLLIIILMIIEIMIIIISKKFLLDLIINDFGVVEKRNEIC